MKRVAILQSNYISWKGYFDLINFVDEFVIYDCMQYTKRDWRNKNYIKSPQGRLRLSVPVQTSGKYYQSIYDTKIDGDRWSKVHWNSLLMNYSKASFFEEICDLLRPIYLEKKYTHISDLNYELISVICEYLGIKTKISSSREYSICEGKTERLVSICKQANATEYWSGAAAQCYIDKKLFDDQKISLFWMNYHNYKEYPQLWGKFTHQVSILDLLFNCGKESTKYMKSF